jgi:hypothetical protein
MRNNNICGQDLSARCSMGGFSAFQAVMIQSANVRFGSKTDICAANGHVRFTPESGHVQCTQLMSALPAR